MSKSKVIIWRSFPSPSNKKAENESTSVLDKAARLMNAKPSEEAEIDQETVERWTKLADIAMDSSEQQSDQRAEPDEKISA